MSYHIHHSSLVVCYRYGNIYGPGGGQAIIGHQFVDILRAQRGRITTTWNDRAKEHFMQFEVSGIQNTMYYPTERSVAARVELAKSLNVGLSLWELGQGLEHFYDLL
jgi:chitinase domain-containing protein 1